MTSASAVSAALRRAGFSPLGSGTSRMREGIRVSSSLHAVTVTVDLDHSGKADRMAADVEEALTAAGYAAQRDGILIRVAHDEALEHDAGMRARDAAALAADPRTGVR